MCNKGEPKERWKMQITDPIQALSEDINQDGECEVIVSDIKGVYALKAKDGSILWKNEELPSFSIEALVDFNKDGNIEVIGHDGLYGKKIYVLSGKTGKIIKSWQRTKKEISWWFKDTLIRKIYYLFTGQAYQEREISIVVPLDTDGRTELIFVSMGDPSYLHLLDWKTGKELWSFRMTGNSYVNRSAIADLDGDGKREILIHSHDWKRGARETLFCLDYQGNLKWKYNFNPAKELVKKFGNVNDYGYISTIIADFDHDGELEVFSGTDTGIYLLDRNGRLIWRAPTGVFACGKGIVHKKGKTYHYKPPSSNAPHFLVYDAAVGDLNNDGCLDVVIGLNSDYDLEYTEDSKGMVSNHKYHHVISRNKARAISGKDGSIIWEFEGRYKVPQEGGSMFCPVIVDLNEDGELDVVVSSNDNHLYGIKGKDGEMLWEYPLQGQRKTIIADVDGDNHGEVLVVSENGLSCLDFE
jgi:outer membrane protein assembly factor BamB